MLTTTRSSLRADASWAIVSQSPPLEVKTVPSIASSAA